MEPIYLKQVEEAARASPAGEECGRRQAQGMRGPEIVYLFAYKPRMTDHLSRFTQELMRGPSPLAPGMRELIAAFTSSRNQCPF